MARLVTLIALLAIQGSTAIVGESLSGATAKWKEAEAVSPLAKHEVVFALYQNNLDVLEETLYAVSTPGNPKYGQFLSSDDLKAMINTKEAETALRSYLHANGCTIVSASKRGEYIRASAPVGTWNKLFQTEFHYYTYTGKEADKKTPAAVRAKSYTLDAVLADYVHAVLFTTQLPVKLAPRGHRFAKDDKAVGTNYITPEVLNSFYNIDSNIGSTEVSQAVFETGGQNYSPENLEEFQAQFALPTQEVTSDVGGHDSSTECDILANECGEANLDVQYMMALSQTTPMTYYYESNEEDPFTAFVESIAAEANPPLVNSISYGSLEPETSSSIMTTFNNAVMGLGAMGVSVFVSSGDDGVANYECTSQLTCGYVPSFPATSPYVTAVGATYSSSWDTPGVGEVVCQSNVDDAVITSGGGFSTEFDSPSYQTSAVSTYFDTVETQPVSGYSKTGRGYPDLALSGFGYEVVIGADIEIVCGTSCSSPSVAAMASLVNSIRTEAGSSSIGFINPALYQNYSSTAGVFNDVTSGENQCTADNEVCCDEGFYAAPGWDPTTGFGSVDYAGFEKAFTSDLDQAQVQAAKQRLQAKAMAKARAAAAAK